MSISYLPTFASMDHIISHILTIIKNSLTTIFFSFSYFYIDRLLEDRVTKLSSHLHHCQQHIRQAEASGGMHNIDYGTKELHQLFEDLHWLVLISGMLLRSVHTPCCLLYGDSSLVRRYASPKVL